MKCEVLNDGMLLTGTDLPANWQAYLVCEKSFSNFNAFGQGYSIDRMPEIYQYCGPRRYFYVVDAKTRSAFSPTFVPMMSGLKEYTARFHPAFIEYAASSEMGVDAKTRVAVDPVTGAECWEFRLENRQAASRDVEFYAVLPFIERRGFGARGWHDKDLFAVISHVTAFFVTDEEHEATKHLKMHCYIVADSAPVRTSSAIAKVLPIDELASRPEFIVDGKLADAHAYADKSCGAMQFNLTLAGNSSQTIRIAVGASVTQDEIAAVKKRLDDGESIFASAMEHWKRWDAGLRVTLPDKGLEGFINTFAKHQTRMNCVTARWSQAPASRNWIQDWQAAAYLLPEDALDAFCKVLSAQRSDGWIPQGFKTSAFGRLVDALGKDYRDGPVWVPPLALKLLEVLGDATFLDKTLPYSDKGEASVLEHILQAMKFLAQRRGEHGLVLFGEGDWNDQLNNAGCKGRGESVWISTAFIHACRKTQEICEWIGKPRLAADVRKWGDEVSAAINTHAWDGKWYIRGFTDDGKPFGSHRDDEGKIYLEPQAWALMAGAVPADRVETLLDSVRRELLTPYGVRLLTPPYRRWHPELGRISVDLPGNKENGSAYSHGTLFHAAGLFAVARADEACELATSILPSNPRHPWTRSGQNPVYIPNGYLAPEAGDEFSGRGSNYNWTGSAPTLLMLVMREMFGIQGTPEGVRIRPGLHSSWNEADIETPFRKASLKIRYRRDGRRGVFLGGKKLDNDTLKNIQPGKVYELEVGLG